MAKNVVLVQYKLRDLDKEIELFIASFCKLLIFDKKLNVLLLPSDDKNYGENLKIIKVLNKFAKLGKRQGKGQGLVDQAKQIVIKFEDYYNLPSGILGECAYAVFMDRLFKMEGGPEALCRLRYDILPNRKDALRMLKKKIDGYEKGRKRAVILTGHENREALEVFFKDDLGWSMPPGGKGIEKWTNYNAIIVKPYDESWDRIEPAYSAWMKS